MRVATGRWVFPSLIFVSFTLAAQQPAATSPAGAVPDRLAQLREDLGKAEAAHPGNSKEVVEAMDKLTNEEMDEEKLSPETLERAQREVTMALAAAGDHTEMYADSMVTCALVLERMGRPADARPLVDHAFAIVSHDIPDDYGAYTEAANALASVCFSLGDYACSVQAYTAAIAVEQKEGPGHELEVASSLTGRASVRDLTNEMAGAGQDLEAALDAAKRGKLDDLNMGSLESNIGVHYSKTGEFDKAIVHTNAALELIRRSYGPDSPLLATITGNLGDLYTRTGDFQLAYQAFETALKDPHESVDWQAWNYAGYARALAAGGELKRAIDIGLVSAKMAREEFVLQARTLPERQALDYSRHRANGLAAALSVVAKHPGLPNEPIYQEVVRSRGLVAEEMARRERDLNQSKDPEVERELAELDKARTDVLNAGNAGAGKTSADAAAEATARMEKIERELAERSAAVRNDQRTTAMRLEDVRAGLPVHSALVSYVVYPRFAVEAVDPQRHQTLNCIAFVLREDSPSIKVFDLGEAKSIDELVSKLRASADAEAHSGGIGSIRNERLYRESGLELRRRIWDPLLPALAGAKLVLIVPDGQLNLVPFSALPAGKGYLVERSTVLHMLTSERDLVMPRAASQRQGLLAVGGPSFDLAVNHPPAANSTMVLRGGSIPCDDFKKMQFDPLPGSVREVSEISTEWKRWSAPENALLLTGENATRERFLDESTHRRILHVATHAFVLDRSCGNGNPLLHSGLVFAGANRSRQEAILTAQQIASLDLVGVDWAVLSACNTGNGELRDGEGVVGLERAFRVAGARSVVMTLWPVDDEVTRSYMRALYRERFEHHDETAQAAWEAARTVLAQRRSGGQSTHPWYWAGFVAAGDWK